MSTSINGWALIEPKKPLQKQTIEVDAPAEGEVLVEVAGCGVCHTDLSYFYFGVPTGTRSSQPGLPAAWAATWFRWPRRWAQRRSWASTSTRAS
jgi:hypothetical protein